MNILLAEDRNQISDVWLSCSLKKKVSTEIQKMAVMFSLSLSLSETVCAESPLCDLIVYTWHKTRQRITLKKFQMMKRNLRSLSGNP